MPKNLSVYSSSAGSGKTYTLAKEYIKLLISNTEPFDSFYFQKILAVTFTKDAANEMKERILKYLEGLVKMYLQEKSDDKTITALLSDIKTELAAKGQILTDEQIGKRAEMAFTTIINHYSDFSVSTIDSFFQQIINAFAMQLGYSNNLEIILDADELLLPAAERFISKVGSNSEQILTNAIIDYTNELADDGKSWQNLSKTFADFAKNIFSDSNLLFLDKVKDLSLESVNLISKQMKAYLRKTEESLEILAKEFVESCDKNNLEIEDFYRGAGGGILSVFNKRKNGVELFEDFTKTVLSVRDDQWYSKTSKIKETIDNLKEELLTVFEEYDRIRVSNKPKYYLYKAINKNLFKLSLLKQFQFEVEEIKTESGVVHISEFNKAILDVVANEPVPYIYERIGEKYKHIMIDEFQDTSPIQFQNFLPLINNSLAGGGTAMLVGDPKQAIYRFRGGDMKQIVHLFNKEIDHLQKYLPEESFLKDHLIEIEPHISPEMLNTNYRSCSEIIQFNNNLFDFIRNHDQTLIEKFPMILKAFDDDFIQKEPLKVKSGGHVQINFSTISTKDELDSGNAPNKVAENESNIENFETDLSEIEDPEILKLINKCKSDNFEYGDIAILCRTGKTSKIIANYLKNNDIPVISSDSVLLAFSKAVNLVISLMQVLAESNSLNRHQAIFLFHQTVLDEAMPSENEELKKICQTESLIEYFEYFQNRGYKLEVGALVTQSVYEIAEYLIYAFQLLGQQKDQEYIFAFLDEILKFKLTKSDNLPDFLAYWEKNKSKLTIVPSSSNAVTISTIHKAKGLQYPIVIIPEAKWNLGMDPRSQIWVHLDELGYEELTEFETENVLSVANLPHTKELENTEIADQYRDEAERYYLEAINLLYVALTRPEQRLYLLARLNKSKNESKPPSNTISELLYEYLNSNGLYNAENAEYIINEGVPYQKSLQVKEANFECISVLQYDRANMAKLKISNSLEQIASRKSAEKGNKIHLVLSKIKYKTDIQAAIKSCLEAGNIGVDETETIGEQINTIISHPQLKDYYEMGLKMANEIDILLPNGNSKRPDRVVFYKDKTVIIDYKTGIEMPEHKSQIRNYGNLFIDMKYPMPIMYLVYLENLKVIEC